MCDIFLSERSIEYIYIYKYILMIFNHNGAFHLSTTEFDHILAVNLMFTVSAMTGVHQHRS